MEIFNKSYRSCYERYLQFWVTRMRFICRTIESEHRKLYECIGLELIDFVFDW